MTRHAAVSDEENWDHVPDQQPHDINFDDLERSGQRSILHEPGAKTLGCAFIFGESRP